jgi:hypothetical protein
MKIELPIKTAIVCHDAGAANIIIATLLKAERKYLRAYMQGPAKKIWNFFFPEIALYDSIDEALKGSELLISGTGWSSDVEHESRRIAKKIGVKSIAVIDHWANYLERFIRNEEQILPDEIWVTDKYALDIALETFPNTHIFQITNFYLEKQLKDIALRGTPSKPELLYILEPVRSNWGRDIPGEFQALEYFFNKFPTLGIPKEAVICLRPHPSEHQGKYISWMKSNLNLEFKLDNSINITESLARASWVAGCESFALVLALMAGRKVYSSLPPWAPPFKLPHRGFIKIRELNI